MPGFFRVGIPTINAADPAAAEYSSASPGLLWAVSDPIASPYFICLLSTMAFTICSAAVPALQANSRSAAWQKGFSLRAETSIPLVGFTAYGWLSDPTKTAPISPREISEDLKAASAASNANVKESSSGDGTDFSMTPIDSACSMPRFQWAAMVLASIRQRGM